MNPIPVPQPWEHRDSSGSKEQWYHKAGALLFVFFCFEVGAFLVVFPWLDLWDYNYFSALAPGWEPIWASPYVRGAVSGLGLLNIWISFAELFRLRRFSRRDDDPAHPLE
ncbi:MAG TPA: hypothetical protein VN428_10240 [Bryobacteraceae bacterium]|nr:hypothetical protein [Bryobacteraceae bacterium]